jgi:hypothetical protein
MSIYKGVSWHYSAPEESCPPAGLKGTKKKVSKAMSETNAPE